MEHLIDAGTEDIDCYKSDGPRPCKTCTLHHTMLHSQIEAAEEVPKKKFCGCAVNCVLFQDRGMETLQGNILATLNKAQLATAVESLFERRKLRYRQGHKENYTPSNGI